MGSSSIFVLGGTLQSLICFLARDLKFELSKTVGSDLRLFSHKNPDCTVLLQRAPKWPASLLLLCWDWHSGFPAGLSSCLGYLEFGSCGCSTSPRIISSFFDWFSWISFHRGKFSFVQFLPSELFWAHQCLREKIWNVKLSHSLVCLKPSMDLLVPYIKTELNF